MPTIIKGKEIKTSTTYEPGVLHRQGICAESVESLDPPFTLQYGTMPPGQKTRPHFHHQACRGNYIIKGRLRYIFGPSYNQQICEAGPGDYLYTPLGEIHWQINL